jgi:putrescine aminotransferase
MADELHRAVPFVENPDQVVEQTLNDYGNYVNDAMARLYRFMGLSTLEWEASGAIITDIYGQQYIDCGSYGVMFHGHSHPKVVAAVREQLDRMAMHGRTLPHKWIAELGKQLAEITPGDLQYSFFCNSGAEANEGALKLARAYTKKPGVIATKGAFHGKTFGALSASGRELYREPFYPLLPGFIHVPFGDWQAVEAAITPDVGAVIVEPIQGEGGVIVPPDDYLPGLRDVCDRHGLVLILDEVQTGMGRTGKYFACNHWNVVPDILTSAKALGGGVMPIGAITAKPAIFELFNDNPYIHSSTFGGNPLACVAGIAAITALKEEGLVEQAAQKGEYILNHLRQLQQEYPQILKDVRGKGLLIGLQLGKEAHSGVMISELASQHVIVIHSLNNPFVIRLSPPAIITYEQIDIVLDAVSKGVAQAAAVDDDL